MKHLKKIICMMLVALMLTTSIVFSAGATGTIAYGAGTVSASLLNIRSGPGTNYTIVDTVSNGSKVVILEQSETDWYKINYNGSEGYVSAQYIKNVLTAEDFDAVGTVNDSDVRFRTGPSTSNSIIGTLAENTEVEIIGINSGWYKIVHNGNTGYMRSDYIDIISESQSAGEETTSETEDTTAPEEQAPETSETPVNKSGSVTGNSVRMRTEPSLSAPIMGLLNKGTKVDVLAETDNWYKITYGGNTGYMSSDYISLAAGSEESEQAPETTDPDVEAMDEVGYVTGNYVRFRKGPATNTAIITTLNNGTSVKITGKTDGWYQIQYNGSTGYMSADYISVGEAPTSSEGSELGRQIADYTLQFNGGRYVYGGSSPSVGFDCSGLMYYVYGQFGYSIQRTAGRQYYYNGVYVSKGELQPGDLVFFSSNGYEITHVGMYIGDSKFIHASTTATGIKIDSLDSSYYQRVYYGAKRII